MTQVSVFCLSGVCRFLHIEINEGCCGIGEFRGLDQLEIRSVFQIQIAVSDDLRIGSDLTPCVLSEDAIQSDGRHDTGSDHLTEYCTGTDGRKLVRVSDKNQLRTFLYRLKQM